MRISKAFLFLTLFAFFFSCKQERENIYVIDGITVDASFKGARLNSFESEGNDLYVAHVFPENEPVNESAWYAFKISSKKRRNLKIKLKYKNHKHRYIPKISHDGINWEQISKDKIIVDTILGEATLSITVSYKKMWLAAQEVISSNDTYTWLDNILETHNFLEKEIAGKTALDQNNYVVISESKNTTNSIVLIARQHPPEVPGGTIGFKAFFEELIADSELAKQFREHYSIYTFPLLNPDGADLGNWRHNANGLDLNRDWIDFTQPETKMVKEYLDKEIKKGARINFAIDFHTSYSGPYLLVLDSINEIKTKKIIPTWIQNIETNSQFRVEARRRSQELPYCYNYFYNKIGCEAVTYEEGDEIDRDIIKKRAKIYAQELMKTLLLININESKN